MSELMDEVTAVCDPCGVLLTARYARRQNPQKGGLCAAAVAVHRDQFPEYEISYRRESEDEATARRAAGLPEPPAFDPTVCRACKRPFLAPDPEPEQRVSVPPPDWRFVQALNPVGRPLERR